LSPIFEKKIKIQLKQKFLRYWFDVTFLSHFPTKEGRQFLLIVMLCLMGFNRKTWFSAWVLWDMQHHKGPDYMVNFTLGLNFSSANRAEILARLLKQILLKSNCQLHREGQKS